MENPKKGKIMTSINEKIRTILSTYHPRTTFKDELVDEIKGLIETETKSPKGTKKSLDQYGLFLKGGISSAIDQKVDGKRDWESLGIAINRFDSYLNPDLPTWEMDPFAWIALDPFSRFLVLTGHSKSGWSSGGSRRIDGLKVPSSTGKSYDRKRDDLNNRLIAMDMEIGETIMRDGETVRLSI